MKYFTPDLYLRGQSQDDYVLDEVARLWEEASERYVVYLDSVRSEFPPGLRHIDSNYYLHDAKIHAIGQQGNSFVIHLQLDTPPHSLVTFTFNLLQEPVIQKDVLPPNFWWPGAAVEWLYDEWEKLPGESAGWAMFILLSNGWEVRLQFRDVQVQEARAILPAPRVGSGNGAATAIPQTAS